MTGEIIRLSSISLSRWWWGWRKQVLSEYEGEDDNRLSWLPSLSIYVEAVDWLCGNSCWQCCLKGNKERIRMGGFNISFRGKNSVIRKGKVAKPKQVVVFRKCSCRCDVSPQQSSNPRKPQAMGMSSNTGETGTIGGQSWQMFTLPCHKSVKKIRLT